MHATRRDGALTARQLADFVGDAVLATDRDNRVTYWNAAAERLFGWSAAEVQGRPAFKFFEVSFKSTTQADAVRLITETGRWSGIVTQLTKDGRTLTCEAIVARLPGEEGRVVVLRDLAERQTLVDQRREAEDRLAAALAFNTNLVDAAPVGILTYRVAGPCLSANAEAAAIVGATIDQLRRQNFRTITSWQRSGLLSLAEKAIASGMPIGGEVQMVTTYGRHVWLLVRLAVFQSQSEDILLLVMGDISELKRTQEELLEAESGLRKSQEELRKLSRAIEQSSSSIVITDRAGEIEYVNPSFSAMSGYAPVEVIGRNPRLFKSGETPAATYRELWSTIIAGQTWRGELHNKGKSGDLYWVRVTISPIFGDAGAITHFVAIEENINAQKAAEDAAREAERRYVSAQRMEAIGQLAGGIAHDFNNLLSGILGYSDLVLEGLTTDDGVRRDVEEIKKAGERAARLTRQLLAFSRKQRLEPQNINLNHIVDDLTTMIARTIGEHIRLDVTTDASLGLAKLDAGQTEQIVMNLVINARDAMPGGGRLSIATANVDLDDAFVRAHAGAQPGPHVALTISDTGTGMTPAVVARIFEPFFTTKAPGHGTGLGLATLYGIVKQSNGYVDVDSRVGAGTTFSIYFPRLGAGTIETGVTPHSDGPMKGTETILVVEDEIALRDVIARSLRRQGYTVLLASDGRDALDVESRHAGRIDLLLSDLVMRDVGGLEVAARLVRRRPSTKVLLMSGFHPQQAGPMTAVDPRMPFLAKPFTPADLARKVREVMDS